MPDTIANIIFPRSPAQGDLASPARASQETLDLLATRRSTPILLIGEPGPTKDQLAEMIRLAARVPDHGKLGPWRFIALYGEARARAGAAVAEMLASKAPETPPQLIEHERNWFLRAPASVIVVHSPKPSERIPEWEQRISTAMAAFQLQLAAHAMGFASVHLSARVALDPDVRPLFGLGPDERIIGTVFIGTAKGDVPERERVPPDVVWW